MASLAPTANRHRCNVGKPQLVVIAGPTASGKTALGVELAGRCDAEIVSADSRQVYRYLDIGTAKPTSHERRAVRHHLLDVVEPEAGFDVARFRRLAQAAIDDIRRRGKRVVVVGGTGLYIRALTRGLCAGPPADAALRARLRQQEAEAGGDFLHRRLQQLDPPAAARLHPHDMLRLVRALEVVLLSGTPLSQWQARHGFREQPFDTLMIGLKPDRARLYERIGQRCREMVQDGLVEELRGLWQRGYSPDLPVLQTIGYAQMRRVLENRSGLEEALTDMAQHTRRLAKRQMTWFRAEPEMCWFEPGQVNQIWTMVARFFQI